MSNLLRLTLRQKLLGGFLLCAVFTGLAGGAGILSLNQIQEKMGVTTKDISATIEEQNNQSRTIADFRALVDLITTAESKEVLNTAKEKLQQQAQGGDETQEVQEAVVEDATSEAPTETDDLSVAVNNLIGHQANYLTASDQLAKLQKATDSQLEAVTELAEKVAKEIEKNAETMIAEALSDVSQKMEKSMQVTESALANVKTAIMVPSLSNAINALVKDAILAKEAKEVEAIKKTIEGLLKSTKTLLSKLPKDDTTAALEKLMQKLTGDFDFLVSTKGNQIALGYSSDSNEYQNLLLVAQDCNDSLVEMTKLATGKANSVEFMASEDMNKMAEATLGSLESITETTAAAISHIEASIDLEVHSNKINSLAKDVLLAGDSGTIAAILKAMMAAMEENQKQVAKLTQDNKTVAAIKTTLEQLPPFLKNMAGAKTKMIEARENLVKATESIYAQVSKKENQRLAAAEAMKLKAEQSMEASNAMVNKWQYALILLGVSALMLAVFVGLIVSSTVTKPVAKAVGFAEKMSQGDFTQTLEIKQKDEIGMLAGALNSMITNLGGMFKEIATGVGTLDASSKELSNISHHMSEGANNTSSKSNTVSAAAEEMSSNMDSVAATMEETATNVGLMASAAEQMTASINEIAQNTEKARSIAAQAVSESDEASVQINELGKAAKEIGKVTEAITEISEQTNLLALNATIEAARAGESGKGFAVVANEIKELARQTAEATGEIKKEIDGVQRSTEGTVVQIEQISKVINQLNEIVETIATAVEEQSVTTKEIAGNVVQASQGIQEVTQNVTQATTVTGEMTRDISEVNQASGEIANSSSQVNMSAQELYGLADQLKEAVGRFKV